MMRFVTLVLIEPYLVEIYQAARLPQVYPCLVGHDGVLIRQQLPGYLGQGQIDTGGSEVPETSKQSSLSLMDEEGFPEAPEVVLRSTQLHAGGDVAPAQYAALYLYNQ